MRSDTEIARYQKSLIQYRDQAKATIAVAQPNSPEFTEAIKVFLRCDGAVEAMNWVLGLDVGDFSVTPAGAQRRKVNYHTSQSALHRLHGIQRISHILYGGSAS
jgi:hypothetical protein